MKKLPDDHSLLIILARLDLQEGRPAEAEQWLRHALDTDPTDPQARYALASSLQEQDRLEEAAAELDRCDKDKATLRRQNQLLENEAAHSSTDPAALFEIGSVFLRSG